MILTETDRIDNAELRSKLIEIVEMGYEHSQRLGTHFALLYDIARSTTIEEIARAMSVVDPGVEVVVTDDARRVPSPSDELIPALWMLVDSQRRLETERVDPNIMAVIRVDIDDRNYCRVIVGPDKRERNDEWKDVTEEACKVHWLGAVAAAVRAAGIELHVRSNGPLAEVTLQWAHAV